jgi:hypothetical protein
MLIAGAVIKNHANAGELSDLLVFSRVTAALPVQTTWLWKKSALRSPV